ncbi:hypothetical protein ACI65C_012485 [Semiaphis heraclei]
MDAREIVASGLITIRFMPDITYPYKLSSVTFNINLYDLFNAQLYTMITPCTIAACGLHYDQRDDRGRKRRREEQSVHRVAAAPVNRMPSSPAPTSTAAMAGGGLIVVLLMLWACVVCGARADCPAACECKWRSGKESAICASANMTAVPRHLDYGTQLLDLNDNPLYRLGKDAFADADLLNLQKLYLSRCRIKALDRYAFRKLNNLVELDLSHNSIPVVPSAVLESVPELRELRLNGNPIMKVPNGAFAHVPRLVRLDVSGCRVALLESTAFAGLENSLEWLRLDNNQLRDVKPSTVVSLARLHGVQLNDNPWNCSCKLRPLREWMVRRNVPFGAPPVCKTPVRLAKTPWDKLDLDDFACEPHSVPVSAVVMVTEGDNATVSCRMYGVPIPSSRWTRNDRPLGQTGRSVPVTEGRYTNLTIVSAVAQDGGSYACELENRSGISRSNVTVVVIKRSPQLVLGADRYALPGLIVGVILILSFCLIFLCGLAIRSKGSPTGSRGVPVSGPLDNANIEADPFDRYEKIEMDRDDNNKSMQHRLHQLPASSSDMNGRPDPPGYAESAVTSGRLLNHSHDEHEDYDGLPPIDEPPSSTAPSITDRPTARPSHPTTNVLKRFYLAFLIRPRHLIGRDISLSVAASPGWSQLLFVNCGIFLSAAAFLSRPRHLIGRDISLSATASHCWPQLLFVSCGIFLSATAFLSRPRHFLVGRGISLAATSLYRSRHLLVGHSFSLSAAASHWPRHLFIGRGISLLATASLCQLRHLIGRDISLAAASH